MLKEAPEWFDNALGTHLKDATNWAETIANQKPPQCPDNVNAESGMQQDNRTEINVDLSKGKVHYNYVLNGERIRLFDVELTGTLTFDVSWTSYYACCCGRKPGSSGTLFKIKIKDVKPKQSLKLRFDDFAGVSDKAGWTKKLGVETPEGNWIALKTPCFPRCSGLSGQFSASVSGFSPRKQPEIRSFERYPITPEVKLPLSGTIKALEGMGVMDKPWPCKAK